MKTIEIKCTGSGMADLDSLSDLQGSLKSLSKENLTKLKKTIVENGFIAPFFIWNGKILDGHQRRQALLSLRKDGYNIPKLPTVDIHAESENEARKMLLSISSQYGEWNLDVLSEWETDLDLKFDDLEINIFRFVDKELLFFRDENKPIEDDEFIEPEEIETDIVNGDLIEIGQHRLLCGDSTDSIAVQKLMNGKKYDVLIFDPPYDVEELYQSALLPPESEQKLLIFWDFKRFALAGKSAIDFGWMPQYELIWDCVTSWYTPNRPLARHKACGVFGEDPKWNFEKSIIHDGKERKAGIVHNTRGESDYKPLNGAVHLRTIESFPTAQENAGHAHSKPVKWISAIFNGLGGKNYLDLFGGSGTTMFVCEQQKRKSFTMELEPKNCQIIIDRMQNQWPEIEIKINGI